MQVSIHSISEYVKKTGLRKAEISRVILDLKGFPALPNETLFRLDRNKNGFIAVDENNNPVFLITKLKKIVMTKPET